MKMPKTQRGFLKLLIKIANHGNDFEINRSKITIDDEMTVGAMIANIQNDLGEAESLLNKYKLKYPS